MKQFILAVTLFTFSSMTYAFHCPADAKAIDQGLSKATLSDDHKSEIIKRRNDGIAKHESGDHKGAVDTLSKAMRLLLTSME